MSSAASVFEAGSRTRPFLIRSMRKILFIGGAAVSLRRRFFFGGANGIRAIFRRARNQQVEKRHANGDAVGDLFENAGLRAVGDFGRDFAAAIHGAGMQYEGIGFGAAEALGVELIAENIIFVGDGRFVHAFGLHAKDEDDVGVFESFFEFENAADGNAGCGDSFQFLGNPHGGAT